MSYNETRALLSLLIWVLLYGGFAYYLRSQFDWGQMTTSEALRNFAISALAVIAISIVLAIALEIGGSILQAIITGEQPSRLGDERDRLLELKSMQIGFVVFSLGFLAVLAGLALSWLTPLAAFIALFYALVGAQIVGVAVKLALYRWGV